MISKPKRGWLKRIFNQQNADIFSLIVAEELHRYRCGRH